MKIKASWKWKYFWKQLFNGRYTKQL